MTYSETCKILHEDGSKLLVGLPRHPELVPFQSSVILKGKKDFKFEWKEWSTLRTSLSRRRRGAAGSVRIWTTSLAPMALMEADVGGATLENFFEELRSHVFFFWNHSDKGGTDGVHTSCLPPMPNLLYIIFLGLESYTNASISFRKIDSTVISKDFVGACWVSRKFSNDFSADIDPGLFCITWNTLINPEHICRWWVKEAWWKSHVLATSHQKILCGRNQEQHTTRCVLW